MSTLPPWPPQLRSLEAEERAARALHRAWRDVSHAGEGERNDRLNRAAFSAAAYVREGLIALAEVRQALTHAADRCGLPAREAAATIESGLRAGLERAAPVAAPVAVAPQARPFALVPMGRIEYRDPDWLVDGLLEAGTLAQVFGDPGAGKSFVALDLAFCVASGADFHGRAARAGPVVYLAGEGHNGLARRRMAWERHRGTSLADAPIFASVSAAQLLDASSAAAVTSAVDAVAASTGPPVLVVVDTVARAMAGGDENSAQDVSAFVAAVDALRERYGCAVLLVHHTGHAEKRRARGSSALHAALDHAYRADRDETGVTLTCTKAKDAAPAEPIHLTLQDVEVARDVDGRPVTSAVLVSAAAPPTRERPMAPGPTGVLRALRDAWTEGGLTPVHQETWRAGYARQRGDDRGATVRAAFHRGRDELLERGLIKKCGGDCYVPIE